jgi:hypothetical protein
MGGGGRAAGGEYQHLSTERPGPAADTRDTDGETDNAQLYPFDGSDDLMLQPASGKGRVCLVAGPERLVSRRCRQNKKKKQAFELVDVL